MEKEIKNKIEKIDELKSSISQFEPFDAQISEHLLKYLDVELTYNSNAIEGSTLSFEDTKGILEKGFVYKATKTREILEVVNHRDALRYIETLKRKAPYLVSIEEILNIHREILKGIDNEFAGKYRNSPVYIRTSEGKIKHFPEFQEVPQLINNLLNWLREKEMQLHPVLLASEFHYRFVAIHPFVDGNGRTSRLLMNLLLIQAGYPMANISVKNRSQYIEAIKIADESNDMQPFFTVVLDALIEMLKLYLETFEKRIIWK